MKYTIQIYNSNILIYRKISSRELIRVSPQVAEIIDRLSRNFSASIILVALIVGR